MIFAKKEQCEIARQCKSNAKTFWKYVNSKSKFKSNIGDLETVKKDGHYDVIDNDMDKANALGDFFSSIYQGA